MTDSTDVEQVDLTDAELVEVLKRHGLSRRTLMRVFGAGAALSAVGGTAAAKNPGGASIDEVFGATYFGDESPPPGLVDHVVELHAHSPGVHDGFPLVEDDTVDRDPATPGVQGDADDDPDELPTEFIFDPVGLHVKPGDVVEFRVHGPVTHTATSFHPYYEGLPKRVPTEQPYTSPPIAAAEDGPGDSWLYRFTTPGVHDVACLPHLPLGMVMRVVVFDPKRDSPELLTDYPNVPPASEVPVFANTYAVLDAPELDDPADIVARPDGQVAWADLTL
jgi:plastocyanin